MTQFETLNGKLDRILARLGETVVVPPMPPPVVPPVVPVDPNPLANNPFVKWKAEGRDMWWIQTQGLQHGLSAADWDLAVAAGYDRPAPIQFGSGPSGFPSGFVLTGTEGGTGVRNAFQNGIFTFKASRTGKAYWYFSVSPGPNTATKVAIGGGAEQDLQEQMRVDFHAIAGFTHALTWYMNGTATIETIVRYAE